MSEPRILLFDIENTPNLGYEWGKYEQNILRFKHEFWILCYGYKWLGDKSSTVVAQPDFPGYEADKMNDRKLMLSLRDLMNEADVAIAHNGNAFDWPKSRTRWAINGIDPPKHVKQIDTLQVARRYFRFNDNSLGALGETLGLGGKGPSGGTDTWLGCMVGNKNAWRQMRAYCAQDVELLEDLYYRFRPFIEGHPNMALIADRPSACPKCGVTGKMQARGVRHFGVTSKRQWQCQNCGGYSHSRLMEKGSTRPDYTG